MTLAMVPMREKCTHLSSFPSASGLGLLGRGDSGVAGRLACLLLGRSMADTGRLPSLFLGFLSSELVSRVEADPEPEVEPVMLILAIVSGLGDLRISSPRSRIGDDGADEVNGRDERLSGSGRLKGAGSAGMACAGRAGRR